MYTYYYKISMPTYTLVNSPLSSATRRYYIVFSRHSDEPRGWKLHNARGADEDVSPRRRQSHAPRVGTDINSVTILLL